MLFALLAKGAEKAGDYGGKPPFPPFEQWHMPSQLFWLAIFFTFLYFVLSRMILPTISDTIEKRQDRIVSDLDQAERLNEEALEAEQALELRLTQARAQARETADKARQKMEEEISEETARVDADIEKKLAAADDRIAGMREQALSNVEGIAVDVAKTMMARFDLSPSDDDVKNVVSSVLN